MAGIQTMPGPGYGLEKLMSAIRLGDIKSVQEHLTISRHHLNAVDEFDYSPIVLASLCGHYDILELLLSLGARCDRDTFQGERAVYSALNDRIRNLLLKYDYSVSVDNKQPYIALVSSLLSREVGCASLVGIIRPRPEGDIAICLQKDRDEFLVHTFVLFARSVYFRELIERYRTSHSGRLQIPYDIDLVSTRAVLRCIYMIDPDGAAGDNGEIDTEKLSVYFGLPILHRFTDPDTGKSGQSKRTAAVEAAQGDFLWLWENYLRTPLCLADDEPFTVSKLDPRVRLLQPDVILRVHSLLGDSSLFYSAHKAMIQSDFLTTAIRFKQEFQFSDEDRQQTTLVSVDVSPEIMEVILKWFYTDIVDIPPETALDLLQAADMLLIERLKSMACLLITTQDDDDLLTGEFGYSIFDVARTGWLTGTFPKLDPFCAKFFANRLERCLDGDDVIGLQFGELICESANRIQRREETDTIELVDDIRYYLSERFRMRFEALPAHMFSDGTLDFDQTPQEPKTEILRTDVDQYVALTAAFDELLVKLGFDV